MAGQLSTRTPLLLLLETGMIVLAVTLAATTRLGPGDGLTVLTTLDGLAKAGVVAGICQLCLFFADMYDLRVVADRRELFVRLLRALAATTIILAVVYYWFPVLIVGRGVFLLTTAFIIGSILATRLLFDWATSQVQPGERLLLMYQEMTGEQNPRVMARLKLSGNFIWGPEFRPKFYLDGEVFGVPADGRVDAALPSGNGRRGGDFEMWFWLVPPVRRVPGIGFFPGRNSRFFTAAVGAQAFGREAFQLALERTSPELRALLPAGYEIDSTQRFSPNEAAALARRPHGARGSRAVGRARWPGGVPGALGRGPHRHPPARDR